MRLTKIKNLAEEKEIKELENLQKILEKIQKREITETKIEVLRLAN
jgi:benzoyl-CoA reductase/2-hydroxyglutaryl-CoA dehydratase subunit BcrC/BadD/HgdB